MIFRSSALAEVIHPLEDLVYHQTIHVNPKGDLNFSILVSKSVSISRKRNKNKENNQTSASPKKKTPQTHVRRKEKR